MDERDIVLLRISALFNDISVSMRDIHMAIIKLTKLIEDNNAKTPPIPAKSPNCS
jgi:hypothetical protein